MSLADALDAIPVVANATERNARFPAPQVGQRVHNLATAAIERWNGTWVTDFQVPGALGAWTNVKDQAYGALGNDAADDTAAFVAAIAAAGSGTVFIPAGTYRLSAAILLSTSGVTLIGAGRSATILKFTGATDGIVLADAVSLARVTVEKLQIQTTNAGALKALKAHFPTSAGTEHVFRDISITSSGGGRWAYGVWGNNFETSALYNIRVVQSATISYHFENFSNAINLYNCEGTGSSGAGTIERAIEIDSTTDFFWHGGTFQGYYTKSLIYVTASGVHFRGTHLENTNGAPSDGTDVVVGNTGVACVNGSFHAIQGGSFKISTGLGTVRQYSISQSEVGAVTFGSTAQGCGCLFVRAASITDNGTATNTVLGCSNGAGAPLANKLPGQLVKGSVTTIPVYVNAPTLSELIANGAILGWLDSAGAVKEILFLSAGDQLFLQYLTALNFRDTAGTQRAQMTHSGTDTSLDLSGTAGKYKVNGTQVVTAQKAAVADVASANASDLATAITLANELKTQVNLLLARLRASTGHGLIA